MAPPAYLAALSRTPTNPLTAGRLHLLLRAAARLGADWAAARRVLGGMPLAAF